MKITIVQQTVKETKEENIAHIRTLLQDSLETDIIVLPEMCLSPYDNNLFKQNAIEEGDSIFFEFGRIAKHQNAYLIAGSVPEMEGGTLYNTTFVFDRRGECIAKYRKIHLFEITYPDGTTYREKDVLQAGEHLVTIATDVGVIGLLICFDIRFPLVARQLRQQGAECLIVPAAFNTFTGPNHWSLAFRSRAVDNQFFTVGVSPSTQSAGTYAYYGHSIVVDPFGMILYEAGTEEEIRTVEVPISEVEKIRKAFPIVSNEVVI
jgi:predicted amidohydrolase